MKRINYFKVGAISYMLLGAMHLLTQLSKGGLSESAMQTFTKMKETTFDFMGQHDLMQFYMGFSLTMGFMLFAFGLQAFVIDKPGKRVIVADISISLVVFILSIIYFHPVAYSFIGFSLLCFIISFFQVKEEAK